MSSIIFENVSKRFILHHQKTRSFQDLIVKTLRRSNGDDSTEDLWVLRDVSFEIPQGQTVGLIGPNGAGKSTMLKMIARIIEPTGGKIRVNGSLNSLIELGAGFHEELTGRENIYLNASLRGMTRREIQKRFDEIVAFSELEKFIDTPVKHYSSGMHVRLGFAIATCIEAKILLVDEVLAVGDARFQRKCLDRVAEMRAQGVTIFLVTHQAGMVERICDRVLLLSDGKLELDGAPGQAIERYEQLRNKQDNQQTDFFRISYLAHSVPQQMCVGERSSLSVTFRNDSNYVWNGEQGRGTRMVSLSYHWLDRYANVHQFTGPRQPLPYDLAPGETITLKDLVLPPGRQGIFRLELDMLAEGVAWFSQKGKPGPQIEVRVLPAGSESQTEPVHANETETSSTH